MKAIILITIILCSMCAGAYCQTFSEWWRQKKTRMKYLRQQVTALEELKETVEKGYTQAEEGVDSIGTVAEEELSEHQKFVQSLPEVKPVFKEGPEWVTTYVMSDVLLEHMNEQLENYARNDILNWKEREWVSINVNALLIHMRSNWRHLEALTTNGSLEMEDDQRQLEINDTEQAIRKTYEVGMNFLRRIDEMVVMRYQQAVNDSYLKNILK